MHRLGIFQSVIENTQKANSKLNNFLGGFIDQSILELSETKSSIAATELSNQQRIQAKKDLRNKVFTSIYCKMLSCRLSNLIGFITLLQTGQRSHNNQTFLDKMDSNQEGGDEDDIMNLLRGDRGTALQSLTGVPGFNTGPDIDEAWEMEKQKLLQQMNYQHIEVERLLQPQTQDEHQNQLLTCERFSVQVFSKIIKPFIQSHLVPLI